MKKSRFTESQIVAVLKEGDAGVPVAQLVRKHGISTATYYTWRSKYAGVGVSDLKRMRELEAENTRLKKMVAERDLVVVSLVREMKDKDGNPYTSTWFDMFRIANGKIVEHWDTALKP